MIARAHIDFQRPARLHSRIHRPLEEAICAAAIALGPIQRHVGVLQQLIRIGAVVGRKGDADAGADVDLWPSPRRAAPIASMIRCASVGGIASGWSMPGSRIANSSPPRRATVSPSRTQAASRSATCFSSASPTGWPSVSLTLLEVVEVEEEQREPAAATRAVQRLQHVFAEQDTVRQAGQRVMMRQEGDLRDIGLEGFERLARWCQVHRRAAMP